MTHPASPTAAQSQFRASILVASAGNPRELLACLEQVVATMPDAVSFEVLVHTPPGAPIAALKAQIDGDVRWLSTEARAPEDAWRALVSELGLRGAIPLCLQDDPARAVPAQWLMRVAFGIAA